MASWRRSCPEGLEIRPSVGKGLGLFTTKALEEGEELFEEDPVCGMALLMFDQPNGRRHCQHCMRFLPETLEGGTSVCCAAGCGAFYCTKACREEAWAHHSVLCGANECWANFEQEARECCNEYYILAARALASLRADTLEEDLWEQSPWSGYASPAWWETMKRPKYEDSDSESSASHGESSSADLDSEDEASLDRFFQSTVRDQTCDMGQKLLSVLEGQVSSLAEALLRAGPEPLGRLMGLLRVNAMALHAFRQVGEDEDQDLARGMAIYSLTSAMNHDGEANCFVSSDPDMPQRCLVRTLRRVEPEEEQFGSGLCIDYLQGSPYTTEQRCQVSLCQRASANLFSLTLSNRVVGLGVPMRLLGVDPPAQRSAAQPDAPWAPEAEVMEGVNSVSGDVLRISLAGEPPPKLGQKAAIQAPEEKNVERPYDIVILGATGFTGRLMVQHLDSLICAGQAKVRAWALVGRHAQKLRTVAASCRTSPTTLVAEGDAVEEVVRQAFVVIAAAGPYALCGEAVVRACVRSSTHYVDVAGETVWMHEMLRRYHEEAKQKGLLLVNACAQVCAIDDVNCYLLAKHLGPLKQFREYFFSYGGTTGGTFLSGATNMEGMTEERLRVQNDPYSLGGQRAGGAREVDLDCSAAAQDSIYPALWLLPAYNGHTGGRIVRRSCQLFEGEEGPSYGSQLVVQIRDAAINRRSAETAARRPGPRGRRFSWSVFVKTDASNGL
ncbi:unnamed protein product [Durusdinium trenchii]|uniref:SET domain-containing protein n=1 Tax=Durusdinium trenchii TaxID=1381693 RepID=A0ABP0LUX9_9DINO